MIFAIWPTAEPTAPAAGETSTVSPGLGSPTPFSASSAVTPLIPSTPSASERGRSISGNPSDNGGRLDAGHLLPSEPSGDDVARSPTRIAQFDDFADRERAHYGADLDRRRIIADVGDPAAHRRFDREKIVADQDLAVRGGPHGRLDDGEMLGLRDPLGPGGEDDLPVDHVRAMPIALRARA